MLDFVNKRIPYIDKYAKVVYVYDKKSEYYEPYGFDYNEETKDCTRIYDDIKMTMLRTFVDTVRTDKDGGTLEYVTKPLFPYQWSFIIDHVNKTLHPKSERVLNTWARQSGKSESIKLTCGFLLSFARLWLTVKMERFTIVLASHDKKSVKKLFKEVKPYIKKGIKLFNDIHPNTPLIFHDDDSGLEDNDSKMEIDRMTASGEQLPYAQIFAITAGAINDSLSANLIIADEAGLIDEASFETSVTPFTTTTNGLLSMIGLPTNDSSSLLFQNYLNDNVMTTKYIWEDIYNLRLMVDRGMAEGYKLDFKNRSKGKVDSSYIRWNYFCDFEDSNGKFITMKNIEDSKIAELQIKMAESTEDNWIVLGVDIAPKRDYFSMTLGEVYPTTDDSDIQANVCNVITLNQSKERVSKDSKIKTMGDTCIKNKVDLLCIDSTSQGLWFIQDLVSYFRKNKIPTQIFPYSYAGANKEALFGYLESNLFNLKLNILKENESWESKKMIFELTTLIKEKSKKGSTGIFYGAPDSDGFSDDHVNSLALFNMGFRYARDSDKERRKFDDGQNLWRPKLIKYKESEEIKEAIGLQKYMIII